ncbi:hypothetical protein DH2020_016527 [Rehmannia glutinosa]|uniref:Protein FAR1-RELATED SEQUENCE n=1 Tax=Rehmannia glutinosa TaxID=99300 RepID=A0ABR0WNE4_REHGL
MEEGSDNSEELMDDEGEEDFEIETNDLGNEDNNQMLQVKGNDLENAIQQVLGIESVDLENDSEQVLGIHGVDLENDSEHVLKFESNGHENNGEQMPDIPGNDNADIAQNDHTQGKSYLPPVEGMEFESYDDAYSYYNCYAKELGFGIRVKSSWTKRNSKEKRGAVLCCNCEGFKTMKEASTRRKETRTGCLAMIRLRLVESSRWRLDEVKLEHNHLFDHQRAQNSRSHKKMEAGAKRKLESVVDLQVQTIKLYRTPAVDAVSYGSSNEGELSNHVDSLKRLKFRNGDVVALHNYFRRAQLADPSFFYIMDLNDEGYLRNVFWSDSRSRAAYGYFGDVVVVDTTHNVSNKHDIPLLSFSGLNHHCQSVLLGCGFLVDETIETYIWLMRAWLTCMSGRPPQTIITDQCKALQGAISEVFPRANHRLCLPLVMQSIREKLGEVGESEIFRTVLNRTVYNSMKVEEFEMGWEEMVQHFAIRDHEWLRSLYEDRERWVPKEALDNFESRESTPALRTRCNYELQVSQLYTKEIFSKFQEEVVLMSSCFSVTQIHANGPIVTYLVKERDADGDSIEAKNFEVVYDKVGIERIFMPTCIKRPQLQLDRRNPQPLHFITVEKGRNAFYNPDIGSNNIDISNPVQWYDHLYRRAMQVVTEGMASQDHHMVAWQAFKESLNKVRLASEKPS